MITVNAAAQVMALGGILLVQTVYLILVARVLGPEAFGSYSFVFSVTQIFLVGGDLGLHNTALRRISARPVNAEQTFATFFPLKVFVSTLLLVLVAGIALAIPGTPETKLCLFFLGGGMFLHVNVLTLSIAFQAHGKLYLASLNSFLLVAFHALIGLTGLLLGGRLAWLGFAYLAAATLALLFNWRIFTSRIHPIRWAWPGDSREFFSESLPVGLGTLFENVALRISFTLLSLLAGSQETGFFSAASRITAATRNLPSGIFSAVLPVMAGMQGQWDRLVGLLRRSLIVIILAALPAAATLFLLAEPITSLLYGPAYAPSAASLKILSWAMIPAFLSISFNHTILSQRSMLLWYPVIMGSSMSLNVILNLFLIPRLGSTGAAVSGLITETLTAFLSGILLWWFVRHSRISARMEVSHGDE